MSKKKSSAAVKAWNTLRLALFWARKGGAFKRRIVMDMNLVSNYLKSLKLTSKLDSVSYLREQELSFDKTPTFHVKMTHHRASSRFKMPNIPCFNPEVDFDYDFECEPDEGRMSFLKGEDQDYCGDIGEEIISNEEEEAGIDIQADEFIANFYQQMKLQRQISYLQYKETLRKTSD